MSNLRFSDNRRVLSYKRGGGEFFQVSAFDVGDFQEAEITLSRYCVPGRVDSYRFHYVPRTTRTAGLLPVQYGSEGCIPLAKALAMVQKDLDRPQVIEMLTKFAEVRHYASSFAENLLAEIHPNSKALRIIRRVIRARMKARQMEKEAEIKARREAVLRA